MRPKLKEEARIFEVLLTCLLNFESEFFADTLPENELLKMNDARSTYKGGTKEQRQKEGFFAQGTVYNKTV